MPTADGDGGILPASFFDLGDAVPHAPHSTDDIAAELASLQATFEAPPPPASQQQAAPQSDSQASSADAADQKPTPNKPKPKKPKAKAKPKTAKDDNDGDGEDKSKSATSEKKDATQNKDKPKPKKTKRKKPPADSDDKAGASTANAAGTASKGSRKKPSASVARSISRVSSVGRDRTTAPPETEADGPEGEGEGEAEPAAPRGEEEDDAGDSGSDSGLEDKDDEHYSTQASIYAAQQRSMGLLSLVMDDDQLDRHMASRRGALSKASVRKLVNHVLAQSVSAHVAMVASGVAKIFIGEIVEMARQVQQQRGEFGPLRPTHLREAHRLYRLERERPGLYPPGTNTASPGIGKRRRLF